jgi:putative RNA 2'-phosphotransferase
MMMTKNEIRHSKRLSWLLRHGAPEAGIRMDPAGWVAIDEVLRYLGMSRATLDAVVRSNSKRRLQVAGGRIRCCQGHSTRSGVSSEALEASWETYEGDALVCHGKWFVLV